MQSKAHLALSVTVLLVSCTAHAVDTNLSAVGFTGLAVTPNANLLGWGRAEFTYDSQLPGIVRRPGGHNYVLGFGLLPNLEIAGRLAANSPQNSNCFVEDCGARDLSASLKAGIGLDRAGRYRVAAGVTDVGGAATYFRSYYAVGTFSEGPLALSAGLARRTGAGIAGSRSPLDGPFASAAWQPVPWIRAHVEYTDKNAWAGVRLFAPRPWLPEGWLAHVGANVRATDSRLTERTWWSVGLSIPLYRTPNFPGSGASARAPIQPASALPVTAGTSTSPEPLVPAQPPAASALPAAAPASDVQLMQLVRVLEGAGLEDLWVGRMPDGSIAIRANNNTYNWNSLDALGAALGSIAQVLQEHRSGYRLILMQRQIPLVAVTGQADCLAAWIAEHAAACPAGEVSTPGTMILDRLHAGADWLTRRAAPSSRALRISLSPVLRTNFGTELATFDYSAGLNVGFLQPLWNGASVEARYDIPLANSANYDETGLFNWRRVRSRLERLAFTQTVRVPLEQWAWRGDAVAAARNGLGSVTAQGSIGRFGSYFDGIHGALRWEPGQGAHRFTAEAGIFRNAHFGRTEALGAKISKPALLSYRYNLAATRTYLEGSAGSYMNNDFGFQVGMRQWFADTAVNIFYRRTEFKSSQPRNFVGLQVSVPIGPRKDMNPAHHFQVTGTPRFTHGVETTVREGRSNPLRPGFGVFPPAPQIDVTMNSDRSGLVYFQDGLSRIREAAAATNRRQPQ